MKKNQDVDYYFFSEVFIFMIRANNFKKNFSKNLICTWSFVCFFIFCVFLCLAIFEYPGGYLTNEKARGFHLLFNFWCDLFKKNAINGELNVARGNAKIAFTFFLLAIFPIWLFITDLAEKPRFLAKPVVLLGSFAVACSATIPATAEMFDFHALSLIVVGLSGITAFFLGTVMTVYSKTSTTLNLLAIL